MKPHFRESSNVHTGPLHSSTRGEAQALLQALLRSFAFSPMVRTLAPVSPYADVEACCASRGVLHSFGETAGACLICPPDMVMLATCSKSAIFYPIAYFSADTGSVLLIFPLFCGVPSPSVTQQWYPVFDRTGKDQPHAFATKA